MPVPFEHPPIRPNVFTGQTYDDEEWLRPSAAGVVYVRGKHGGFDLQDGTGAPLFAVCDGVVKHVDFGPALGKNQFVIRRPDDSGAFYAHTSDRPAAGLRVRAGERVADMGNSSTFAIGVHLHFETLKQWDDWHTTYNCGDDLRAMKEILTMFTADELKFLKNLVKVARERDVDAAELVRAAVRLGQHVEAHGPVAEGHTHTAKVELT